MKIKNKRGFSVIELLLTLFILGALMVLIGKTGRSSMQRASFTTAVNGFVADLAYARQLAAQQNRYVAFLFDYAGTQYTIKVQQRVAVSPMDENNYDKLKTVSPMEGEQFIESPRDFAVNSAGFITAYPVDPTVGPISVKLKFIKKRSKEAYAIESEYDFVKELKIFPSGGVRID